ncbi:MAG: hypothetical protein QOG62_1292 [Thermoleophilaceae bacterium]|jgi:dienelactone hydrolase|nr:hypothetical protein [Thermoleophilaceae bacterium]
MTAAAAALPRPSDLDPRARLRYEGAVAFDYALRTGLATALAGASVMAAPAAVSRSEARRLRFYAELADTHDASRVFKAPEPVVVRSTPGEGPGVAGGRVELLRFDSPYVALNPEMRARYAAHENNAIARAQHWRHEDGPRPTMVVVHGFGASPARFNTAFFGLKELFAGGWDVMLYTLPFHGSRRTRRVGLNGIELFSGGMAHFSEALIHAVHDLRAFIDHLVATGAPRIGMTGLSLGGYTTALTAAVEPRLDFVVPNAAVTWLPPLLGSWFPASVTTRVLRALGGMSREDFARALAVTSPLTYAPVVPKDRLLIIGGLGDRMAPPSQSLLLWEHWDRPTLEWYPGSHILHFGRDNYRAAMQNLLA